MQLSDLIAAVQEDVRDPGAVRWSTTLITRYLNDGLLRAAKISRALTVWTTNMIAGQNYYTLPPDLLIPKYIVIELQEERFRLDLRYGIPNWPASLQDVPERAYIVSGGYYLEPTPSLAGTIYVVGVQRPPQLVNSTDTPSILDCDNMIIAYAAWQCLRADNDPAAAAFQQQYEQERQEFSILDAMKNPTSDIVLRTR